MACCQLWGAGGDMNYRLRIWGSDLWEQLYHSCNIWFFSNELYWSKNIFSLLWFLKINQAHLKLYSFLKTSVDIHTLGSAENTLFLAFGPKDLKYSIHLSFSLTSHKDIYHNARGFILKALFSASIPRLVSDICGLVLHLLFCVLCQKCRPQMRFVTLCGIKVYRCLCKKTSCQEFFGELFKRLLRHEFYSI